MLRAVREVGSRMQSTVGTLSGPSLKGIFPPIPTPFHADEAIAWEHLQENFRKWNKTRLSGYLVQGSNGEYCFLTMKERVDMVAKVKEYVGNEKLVLAGCGCESTRQTIELGNGMADAGADALVVINPSYFKANMNYQSLHRHFVDVANSVRVPVILYNMPANTGVDMGVDLITDLANHHNIIGVKESNGDVAKIARVINDTKGQDFQVLAGSAGFLLGSLSVGAVGGICALANVLPDQVQDLYEKFCSGNITEATELQQRLVAPNTGVTKLFGVPGLKKAMEWYGYYGGPCRKPLLDLTADQESVLKGHFSKNGFL